MAYAFVVYTGDGSTTQFSIPFSYIRKEHVKVYVNYVDTAYTYVNDTTVSVSTAPGSGVRVEVRRVTPANTPLVDFANGAVLTAADLDTANLQQLYLQQELDDDLGKTVQVDDATGLLTAGGQRITSVGTPVAAADAATKNYVDTFVNQTANIADSAITSAKIADGTIATADLANSAVTTAKIADTNVTTGKIADDAVTTAKLAASSVTTAKIADSNVTTAKIADSAVTSAKIADGTIVAGDLASDSVTTAKIVDANVTTAKLADSSVTSAKIADGTIATGDIADSAVTTGKIADSAVTTGKIANDAVTTAKIPDGAVTNTKLADAELQELATMGSTTAAALADLTAAEVQILDGATLSTAELNTLDGITADVTELNQLDGNTLTNSPSWGSTTQYPTAAAIDSRITARIDPIGGFEAIANEDSFPATAPPEGTVVSIANANGLAVNASGVGAGTRTGGGAVVINGFPAGFNSTSLDDGIGLLVVATSTAHTYDFHRVVAKNEDVRQLSSDINDFKARYRIGTTNPTTDNDAGDLFFNTGTNKMLVRNGANDAWEEVQSIGEFFINTISSSGGTGGGSATFNGTAFRFELSNPPSFAQQLIVSINGVVQKPNTGTAQPAEGFALDGADIIFSSAPPSSSPFFIITLGSTVNIGTPSAGTVGTTQLADGGVTTAKIAADAINGTKIADDSIDSEHYVDGSIDTAHLADDAVTAAKLADTAVTPGSYTLSSITVDAQGRITAASSGTAADPDIITEGNTSVEVVDTGSDGEVRLTTEGTRAMTIDSSQRVGIGVTSPEQPLHVENPSGEVVVLIEGNQSSAGAGGVLVLKNNDTGANNLNQIQGADAGGQTCSAISFTNVDQANNEGELRFLTRPSGGNPTEVLRLTSNGTLQLRNSPGIDFSQIQTNATGMTSETLDSYEEGTWTPTWGGTSTYTTQIGRYTKVGNKVTIWFRLRCTSIGTGGSVTLSGLPFGTASNVDASIPLTYWQNINSSAYWLTAYAPGGGYTGLYFMGQTGLDATQEVNVNVGKSDAFITGSGTYTVS